MRKVLHTAPGVIQQVCLMLNVIQFHKVTKLIFKLNIQLKMLIAQLSKLLVFEYPWYIKYYIFFFSFVNYNCHAHSDIKF